MRTTSLPRGALAAAIILALHSGAAVASGSGPATRMLDASDHAELSAEVSEDGVVRIAMVGDRIARVIRAPDGYAVEHDPTAGRRLPAGDRRRHGANTPRMPGNRWRCSWVRSAASPTASF